GRWRRGWPSTCWAPRCRLQIATAMGRARRATTKRSRAHVLPDRPALAVCDGPCLRPHAARAHTRRAGAGEGDGGRLPGDEHLAVPQPAMDAVDLANVPCRGRPRLDAQLGRLS